MKRSLREAIATAVKVADLDAAIAPIMKLLGIESGDVAGISFSDMEDDEWSTLSTAERHAAILEWLETENTYLEEDAPLIDLTPGYTMDEREIATVLAALRYWQRSGGMHAVDDALHDIATNEGELDPLSAEEIDALCEELNTAGSPA